MSGRSRGGVLEGGCSKHCSVHTLGQLFQFYQRRSSGVCDSGPTHPILHRKHLLIINELHQIAVLKVAKHLDVAHPGAILGPAKMGTAIAVERTLRQYRGLGRGYAYLLHHRHSCVWLIDRGDRDRTGLRRRAAKVLKAPRQP
jgi:hypothetical protein